MRNILAVLAFLFATPALAGPCEDLAVQIAKAPLGSRVIAPSAPCDVRVGRAIVLTGGPISSLTMTGQGPAAEDLTVAFTPAASTVSSTPAVRVMAAKNARLTRVTVRGGLALVTGAGDSIAGKPIGRGISVERSERVLLEDCRVSTFHKGVVLYLTADVTVRGCDIGDVRTGTLSGSALSGPVLIEGNRLHDSNPVNYGGAGDHGDFIHFWTDPRTLAAPTLGVTIRGNLLDQGAGFPIMGIYLDDNGNGLGFRDVAIAGNTILSGHGQGILLENVRGAVTGNNLLQSGSWRDGDPRDAPTIYLKAGSVVAVSGNRAADPGGLLPGNDNTLIAGGIQPSQALDLARWQWVRARAAAAH